MESTAERAMSIFDGTPIALVEVQTGERPCERTRPRFIRFKDPKTDQFRTIPRGGRDCVGNGRAVKTLCRQGMTIHLCAWCPAPDWFPAS